MLQSINSLLVLIKVNVSQSIERVFDVLALEGTDFEELKTNTFCEGTTVLGTYCNPILQVDLVSNNNSYELLAWVLLLNSLKPLSQKVEGVWVCYIVHKHDQVGLAKKFKGDFLEDVLTRNVNQMQLNSLVRLAFNRDFFDVVFATLCH